MKYLFLNVVNKYIYASGKYFIRWIKIMMDIDLFTDTLCNMKSFAINFSAEKRVQSILS